MGQRFTEDTASELCKTVERLIHFRDNSLPIDKRTLAWLETTTVEIRGKLSKVGLTEAPKRHTCGELWTVYLEAKAKEVKTSTFKTYEDAKRRFFEMFDENEQIGDLTPARMRDWKTFLKTDIQRARSDVQGFSTSTVAGTIAKAKAVFNWAVRNESQMFATNRRQYDLYRFRLLFLLIEAIRFRKYNTS